MVTGGKPMLISTTLPLFLSLLLRLSRASVSLFIVYWDRWDSLSLSPHDCSSRYDPLEAPRDRAIFRDLPFLRSPKFLPFSWTQESERCAPFSRAPRPPIPPRARGEATRARPLPPNSRGGPTLPFEFWRG